MSFGFLKEGLLNECKMETESLPEYLRLYALMNREKEMAGNSFRSCSSFSCYVCEKTAVHYCPLRKHYYEENQHHP
jgi:hypothetical protein